MTRWEPQPGAVVYLTPTLATAPAVAYRLPRCEVVAVEGFRVTVLLADGVKVTTDRANVRATRPQHRKRKPYVPRPTQMPDGYEEITLW